MARFLVLLVLLVSGVNSGLAGSGSKSVVVQIRAVLDAQVAAWNRGDVPGFMQGYWQSPATTFVGASGILRGWRPLLDRYRRDYSDRAKMGALAFRELEITVLSVDAAFVIGRWQLRRAADHPSGVFTLVFRKFPEGWRIVHDHTSEDKAH